MSSTKSFLLQKQVQEASSLQVCMSYKLPSTLYAQDSPADKSPPKLVVYNVSLKGKIIANMADCWIKLWRGSERKPWKKIDWEDKALVSSLTDVVRHVKKESGDALSVVLENRDMVQLRPGPQVTKYQLSPALATLLGVTTDQHSEPVRGVADLWRPWRQVALICDQLPPTFSHGPNELSVAAPLLLDISDTGIITAASLMSFDQAQHHLKKCQSVSRLSFHFQSLEKPNDPLMAESVRVSIMFQLKS